jgi:hypothetical protein
MRFTIRDLLWLMVVVGLGCGWWIDHSRQAEALDPFAERRTVWQFLFGRCPPPERWAFPAAEDPFGRQHF